MLCTDWARVDRNSAKEFCGWARAAMRFGAMRKSQRLGAGGQGNSECGVASGRAIPCTLSAWLGGCGQAPSDSERPRSRIRAQLDPQDPRLNAATAGDSDVSLAYAACPKGCAIDIRNNDNTLLHSELQTFDGSPITSQAQYLGAIAAAKVADTFGLGSNYTFLFPDQLVLNQLTGQHAVKSAKLIPLHAELTKTLADFEGTKVLLTKDDTNGSRLTNLKRAAKTQTLQQIQ
jgi:hypothetical protein